MFRQHGLQTAYLLLILGGLKVAEQSTVPTSQFKYTSQEFPWRNGRDEKKTK